METTLEAPSEVNSGQSGIFKRQTHEPQLQCGTAIRCSKEPVMLWLNPGLQGPEVR